MHSHANCLMILRGPVTHSTLNARGVSVRPEISSGRELLLDSSPLGRVIKSDCVTGDKPSPRLSAVNPTQVFLHSPIRDVGPSATRPLQRLRSSARPLRIRMQTTMTLIVFVRVCVSYEHRSISSTSNCKIYFEQSRQDSSVLLCNRIAVLCSSINPMFNSNNSIMGRSTSSRSAEDRTLYFHTSTRLMLRSSYQE
jgi:hypothetical protein